MKIKQEISRVLTEFNFDRMSFDEASKQLFDLYAVVESLPTKEAISKRIIIEKQNIDRLDWNVNKTDFNLGFMTCFEYISDKMKK